ncbi:MAG: TonB-dependent receptor [Bacteroidetes bacterium]|nr:TonB-dependent receptor [Bacteroidota bacterium]
MFTLEKMRKRICISIIAFFCIIVSVHAGTTGKIAGQVFDVTNGEPLVGANILIVGTNKGAATDIDGNYFILNLPPGNYSVKVSMLSYASVTINNVRVSVDQTTNLDFQLTEEALNLQDVVVTASTPIVRRDLTSTEAKVSGDDISMMPLEDIQSVINLQAGVVDGHFRGGRSNEVKYLVDGVSVNDAYSGGFSLQVEINSLEEVQVLTGTFNAEYGEALSGVVNQVTKIADDKLTGDFSFYGGDYVSSNSKLFENINHISPMGIYNMQGNVSGPVPGFEKLLKFFLSGRYVYSDGYLYGKRIFKPSDSSDFSANDPADWYIGSTGDGRYVPMNNNHRYTLQGKLSLNVGGGKGIVLSGMYQDQKSRDYNHAYKLNPDGDYQRLQNSYLGILSYTHVISNSAFIDFALSAFRTNNNQYVFEEPLDTNYVNPDRKKDVSGSAFLSGGTENWNFNHSTTTYTAKTDLTWQINQIHQIKTGYEFQYHNLDYEDFQIVVDASTDYKPALPIPGAFNYNIYSTNPYQFALYLQDKIELDYLVVNVGVRFDYFQPDGEYLEDPNKVNLLDNLQPPFPDSMMNTAQSKYQFSPRIGISYPITDKGAIHISYGHFFQVPPFEYLYQNPNFRIPLTGDFPGTIGKTIGNADLKPQQTIMYEIGLQQAITDDFGITATAYYKDIRNLLSTEIFIKNEFKKFSKLINRDYGAVKGITLTFEKPFRNGLGATLDYTFQIAKGNASDPNDAFNKAQANPPIESNKQLVPLDWDRRHSLNMTLTLGDPEDYILSGIGRVGSGFPYTPSLQNQRTGLENSDNKPAVFNIDIYFTKYVMLFGTRLSLFAKIYNLLDTQNEQDVFGDTGRAGYTLELTRNQQAPRGVNTIKEFYTRPDFYSAPRQIYIGFSFSL